MQGGDRPYILLPSSPYNRYRFDEDFEFVGLRALPPHGASLRHSLQCSAV